MSEFADRQARCERAEVAVRNAIVALNTAGMCLLAGRDYAPVEAAGLMSALRDDIRSMIGTAETLVEILGKPQLRSVPPI